MGLQTHMHNPTGVEQHLAGAEKVMPACLQLVADLG